MVDRVMVPTIEETPYTISALSKWTKLIEYSIIYDELKDSFLNEIYNLVDSGHIRYINDNKESYQTYIGFGSPLIYLQLARFLKESYQENQDLLGIDALLLEKDNENDFIAHKIKIKLGISCIKIEEAEKTTTKVNTQLQNFKECLANANKISEWEIVGRKELDQIWPDSIKALGKPYR